MNKLLSFAVSFAVLLIFTLSSAYAQQKPLDPVCTGQASGSSICQEKDKVNPLFGDTGILTRAMQVLALIAGIASIIMVIVGGFKYVTSTGDSAKVSSAKDTILYAIIGAVIALLAHAIVTFVLTRP